MKPEQRQDRSSLRWIRGDLDQTLNEIRQALEAFLEGDAGQIQVCIDQMHHVHGVLDLLQVYGGAMLASEMEKLLLAMSQGLVRRTETAAEALMLGIAQMPAYLEKVENGAPDLPLGLMPLMNDLRAAQDAPLLTETSLFAPKLNAVIAAEVVRPGAGNRDLPGIITARRGAYHRALLNWIRDVQVDVSLRGIRDVLDLLNSNAGTARLRRLLDAAEALCTALIDDDEPPASAVKTLFGRLDRVMKQIIDQGEEAAMTDYPVDLLKNLLFYVTRSDSTNPAVLAVKRSMEVIQGVPADGEEHHLGSSGAADREMFAAVADALGQDLRDIKDQLDLYIRGDRNQLDRLTDLGPAIQRVGDTLGMVGRGDLRTRLRLRGDELSEIAQQAVAPSDDALMSLAADLLFVESGLDSLGEAVARPALSDEVIPGGVQHLSSGDMRQHQQAAVSEARIELAKSKEAFVQYLGTPHDTAALAEAPGRLQAVAGVMEVLAMPEAAGILNDLRRYVDGLVKGDIPVPDEAQQDAIADVVVGAELYMQGLVEPAQDRPRLLSVARGGLRVLGLLAAEDDISASDTAPEEVAAVVDLDLQWDAPSADLPPAQAPVAEQADDAEPLSFEPISESAIDSGLDITDIVVVEADDVVIPEPEPEPGPEPEPEPEPGPEPGPEALADAIVVDEEPIILEPVLVDSVEEVVAEKEAPVPPDLPPPAEEPDDGIDAEILEVFGEEAAEELEVIQKLFPAWRESPGNAEALGTLRRSFHTLKGSGRIVGAENIGEFSWAIENLLNGVIDGTTRPDANVMGLMDEAVALLPVLVAEARTSLKGGTDVSAIHDRAFALASGEAVDAASGPGEQMAPFSPAADQAGAQGVGPIDATDRENVVGQIADESILTAVEATDSEFSEIEPGSSEGADTSLYAVFIDEADGHLKVVADFVSRCRETDRPCVLDEPVRRAMHTLRGSARIADVASLAEVAEALESLSEYMINTGQPVDSDLLDLLERSHDCLAGLLVKVDSSAIADAEWQPLRDEILAKRQALTHVDVSATEGKTSAQADGSLDTDRAAEPNPNDGIDRDLLEIFLDEAKELLDSMEAGLADWQSAAPGDVAPVANLQRTLHTMKGGARLSGVVTVGDISHAMESVFESIHERRIGSSERLQGLVRHAADHVAQDIDILVHGRLPVTHTAVIDALEAAAHDRDWQAIAATVSAVGEVTDAEARDTAMQNVATPAEEASTGIDRADEFADIEAASDQAEFTGDSEMLTDSQLMTDSEMLEDSSFLSADDGMVSRPGVVGSAIPEDSSVIRFHAADEQADGEGFVRRRPKPVDRPAATTGVERVRVASDALDQMVNNAGEVSIYRARIEQQNSSFEFNLGELDQTIERLRSQLRNLELETEAQILSRHEREGDDLAEFDPLEMDRYSTIQQLSRALSETVEDLSNLGQSLGDLSRDTDTLLLQQSRVTTDLQDSLLRTRMVRFSSRAPRLERVVRQTAHSIGKQAVLNVVGGQEDMDRAILERMLGPLEHLLRNAVSHGIEGPEERSAAGKSPQGTITMSIAREGSDILLTLADDGAGLDKERIRAKAIERGLIRQDDNLADDEIYQMILSPGFSTARELSQVSGRGVGMDVVLTEVKQLGGTLQIDSEPGRGSRFSIRLPFTLAITDSLLVNLGDDIYAIPHSSMDGVVRISLEDLRAIYDGQLTSYEYAGHKYSVRYLGMMLGTQPPHLSEAQRWYPLLLVRSGEHRIAIQVDGLMGNRQIVVKSVGAQLSTVRWFTGGTILADGQIALILDINSLVRSESAHSLAELALAGDEHIEQGVSVMVVDDSITVRKVTSRLLERHNMQVITAKDGVDAVTLLQEHHPNVMLLDIEMPRMDGYELARHMRSTPGLSDIPIIMITSRSGEKHRNRAFDLGVKRYLGKPYQEAELLENIYGVLADSPL